MGNDNGSGVAGLGIEKRPDSARLFGRWGQHYRLTENDYFRSLGWSMPLRGHAFFDEYLFLHNRMAASSYVPPVDTKTAAFDFLKSRRFRA